MSDNDNDKVVSLFPKKAEEAPFPTNRLDQVTETLKVYSEAIAMATLALGNIAAGVPDPAGVAHHTVKNLEILVMAHLAKMQKTLIPPNKK